MADSKEWLIKQLKEAIPKIVFFDHDEFGISAEDGTEVDGWPMADYYDHHIYDPNERHQQFGIHRRVYEITRQCGWHCEWINPGMIGLYKD